MLGMYFVLGMVGVLVGVFRISVCLAVFIYGCLLGLVWQMISQGSSYIKLIVLIRMKVLCQFSYRNSMVISGVDMIVLIDVLVLNMFCVSVCLCVGNYFVLVFIVFGYVLVLLMLSRVWIRLKDRIEWVIECRVMEIDYIVIDRVKFSWVLMMLNSCLNMNCLVVQNSMNMVISSVQFFLVVLMFLDICGYIMVRVLWLMQLIIVVMVIKFMISQWMQVWVCVVIFICCFCWQWCWC